MAIGDLTEILFVFVLLALALTVVTIIFRMTILSIVSALSWAVCMALGWSMDQTLDAEMQLPIGTIAGIFAVLMVVMIASVWFLRKAEQKVITPYNHTEHLRSEYWRVKRARQGLRVPPEER